MNEEKINISINDGKAFFANESSVNVNPLHVFFDFRMVSPRVDMRSKERPSIVVEHNVVALEPAHAKQIHTMLGTALTNYEKQFGKIEKPAPLKKLEKEQKKEDNTTYTPDYFG